MAEKSASLENEWDFGPDVPTYDFFQHRDVRNESDLEWLVNDLIYALERGDFLQWEAVVCQELGLPLTERQRRAVGELLNFSDEPDEDRILYIDGIPRPGQLWYEIVRTIASHLLVEHFRTSEVHYAVTTDGWKELVAALEQHGEGLSLPEGVDHPVEVVPAELRHRLWLQTCFGHLGGLGQEEELTLLDPEAALSDRGVHRLPAGAQGERRVPRPDAGDVAEGLDPAAPGRADLRRDDAEGTGPGLDAGQDRRAPVKRASRCIVLRGGLPGDHPRRVPWPRRTRSAVQTRRNCRKRSLSRS